MAPAIRAWCCAAWAGSTTAAASRSNSRAWSAAVPTRTSASTIPASPTGTRAWTCWATTSSCDLGSAEGTLANGEPMRDALLRPGDQVVFDAHHRFVVEAPMRGRTPGEHVRDDG